MGPTAAIIAAAGGLGALGHSRGSKLIKTEKLSGLHLGRDGTPELLGDCADLPHRLGIRCDYIVLVRIHEYDSDLI